MPERGQIRGSGERVETSSASRIYFCHSISGTTTVFSKLTRAPSAAEFCRRIHLPHLKHALFRGTELRERPDPACSVLNHDTRVKIRLNAYFPACFASHHYQQSSSRSPTTIRAQAMRHYIFSFDRCAYSLGLPQATHCRLHRHSKRTSPLDHARISVIRESLGDAFWCQRSSDLLDGGATHS